MSFTYGVGPDHSIFDVYIGGMLWRSYDGYAASTSEVTQTFELSGDGPYLFEIRNRAEKHPSSSGYKMRFKQIVLSDITYDLRTIAYTYDNLSRLIEADYGDTQYTYGFDVAGNLTNHNGASQTYNAANQLIHDGTNDISYDPNGNLTSDGVNSYTWDRANRLLIMGGVDYAYNGDSNRIAQDALRYILDLQPGLAQVIGDSDGNRYVHSLRGIHAVNDGAAWRYPLTDALGSVRGYVDANNAVLSNVNYTPVGVPDANIIGPAFTGEWRDEMEVQYHRARYLNPDLGIWLSRDPLEGTMDKSISLNGYSYADNNPINITDVSGAFPDDPKCLTRGGFLGCKRALQFFHQPVFVNLPIDVNSVTSYQGFGPTNFSWTQYYKQTQSNNEVIGRTIYDFANGMHNGIDFFATYGTPVKAMDWGEVVNENGSTPWQAGPLSVLIRHASYVALYGHLSLVDPSAMRKGAIVSPGQVVGLSGVEQGDNDPHLHLEMRVIPSDYIAGRLESALAQCDDPCLFFEYHEIISREFNPLGWGNYEFINPLPFFNLSLNLENLIYQLPSSFGATCRGDGTDCHDRNNRPIDRDRNGYPDRIALKNVTSPTAYNATSALSIQSTFNSNIWNGSTYISP